MPELPEVETARAYVEQFCSGSTIVKCNATEQGGGPVSLSTVVYLSCVRLCLIQECYRC